MKKKILLAVDNSAHSRSAMQYAVKISAFVDDLSYTLLNVQPGISQFLTDEAQKSIKSQLALEKLKKKNRENALSMLDDCKNRMVEMGIDANRIDLKTYPKKIGLAKDILEYAQEGLYDAIVVGRRGLSRVQEIFMGSLTSKLLEHSTFIPVWVIDGDVTSDRIMIATDGSESSLKAVDHFSFMAARNPNVKVTLFHVVPKLADFCKIDFGDSDKELEDLIISGDKRCVEDFMAHAYRKFTEAGIGKEQIEIKEVTAIMNVGGAISDELEKGNYGTVIIGRRGANKAFFMGSVSKHVLERISNRAVWLIT